MTSIVKMKFNRKIIFGVIAVLVVLVAFLIYQFYFEVPNKEIEKAVFHNDNQKVSEIFVEIADDNGERTRGLMHRESLAENRGMLFIFPDEALRSFWMKNTLIPLDMIFLDGKKNIVSITKNAVPCCASGCACKNSSCPLYSSKGKSRYVIEVNAGFCEKYSINENTKVEFNCL